MEIMSDLLSISIAATVDTPPPYVQEASERLLSHILINNWKLRLTSYTLFVWLSSTSLLPGGRRELSGWASARRVHANLWSAVVGGCSSLWPEIKRPTPHDLDIPLMDALALRSFGSRNPIATFFNGFTKFDVTWINAYYPLQYELRWHNNLFLF